MSARSSVGAQAEQGELCVFFGCHGFVCAMATRFLDRLLLPEDVSVIDRGGRPLDGTTVVMAGGQAYAGWALAQLLEIPPLTSAFMLLRVPHDGGDVPIALETGPCLIVGPLGATSALSPGFFRARGHAFAGAFPTDAIRGKAVGGRIGLHLDPRRLWTPAELAAARATVESATSTRALGREEPGLGGAPRPIARRAP